MRFRPSKKQIIILTLISGALFILLAIMIYRLTLPSPESEPQSLITLLPDAPIGYVSIKGLGGLVQTFARSDFGKQTLQMPLLTEFQREPWWQEFVYQKQLWEYQMGGKLDLKKIEGYFGEEAILAFYKRDNQLSFLMVSAVGAKEKLEIATLTATDAVNPNYKRIKENYRGITISTITGYPRDFSYAFIGKVGVLTLDKSLLQDTIDINAKQKQGFIDLQPMGEALRQRYNTDRNTIYIDFSKLSQVVASGEWLKPPRLHRDSKQLFDGVSAWTFSNRYEGGVIHSQHRFLLKQPRISTRGEPVDAIASEGPGTSPPMGAPLLSILPTTTALLGISNDVSPTALWKRVDASLPIQLPGSQINLSSYLKSEMALALIASASDAPMVMPSLLLIFPITDGAGLEAELMKLKQEQILINGTPLQFLEPQDYNGTALQLAQLRLGFLLSLKGGYAIVDNYWMVGTTVAGLKSAIDTFGGRETALAGTTLPAQFNQSGGSHLLLQPNRFVPELKRFLPILGLLASASGQKFDPKLTTRVMNNLFPLGSLGPITADIDWEGEFVNAEIQIVLE